MITDLGPQLFAGARPARRAAFRPVQDVPGSTAAQPLGGLWTSTYDPQQGSAFLGHLRRRIAENVAAMQALGLAYADTQPLGWGTCYTVLTPAADARIGVIDTYADCVALWERYSRPSPPAVAAFQPRWVSWEAVAADWDAIHLTARAAHRAPWVSTVHADRSRPHLAWWGHECTLWLRWAFRRTRVVRGARFDLSPISAKTVAPMPEAAFGTWQQVLHWERRALGLSVDPLVLWGGQPAEIGRVWGILTVLEVAEYQDPPRPDAVHLCRRLLGIYHQMWARRALQAGWLTQRGWDALAAEGWGRPVRREPPPTGTRYGGYVLWTI